MKNSKWTTLLLGVCSLAIATALLDGMPASAQETNAPMTKAEKKKADKEAKRAAKEGKADKDRNYAADPTKVKFGEFKAVEIKAAAVTDPKYRKKANDRNTEVIDEMLQQQLKYIFPNLKVIPPGGEFSKGGERTLQITPIIEKIKIVSTGARIWGGPMAGGSDIVMHVDYRDSSTGEIIAHPDFWRGNNAWAGGWSMGGTDNQIRDAVVAQIAAYTTGNK
jgi:hypothetical protein